jgi:hypothetical protein
MQLDHAVINVGRRMDAAERFCRDLGFTVTPRGHHSLGSINHLMLFDSDYFELIGLPETGTTMRPDLEAAPLGINGLVFKTRNVDETFARLQTLGMAGEPPRAFTRPVALDGAIKEARFRTVTVRADVFPAGRVYFCEHGTPELVWRPEWQSHANTAMAIEEIVVVAEDVPATAQAYARLVESEVAVLGNGVRTVPTEDARLIVRTPDGYRRQYGDLASGMGGRESIFGALVFRVAALEPLAKILEGLGGRLPAVSEPDGIVVRLPDYDSVLEFRVDGD